MYYVNTDQIEERLTFIPKVVQVVTEMNTRWDGSLYASFAQERALHIAIEIVTDVGSLLIDGFLMRDASSYEDIVDILAQEQVVSPSLHDSLLRLVRLRRALVQHYTEWERNGIHSALLELPGILPEFGDSVRRFIAKEMNLA
ncbi:DUF86 domain-containing protein [Paenibacillus apiarius]|uniref:DUF86 domain-containing protein n=1 Tax=Paenibacillus apiarius TaxID=46240 RepID=A0ABT4DWV6_9BACL|nr:HepT-like ribonuclease domain-containing protein [Paenibacillus apiarius]MCY9515372.1 DUF86 domain-containing protein [Paenibacillus apiarius]MCY9521828.1 DUF86 domain-containing protein [Paenibacillus apiarius]MCY9550221.1 DUF86 domain-containing protein [Paenibacillus apiarius]MCY9559497.1 DUF86 domain-containing protein [Paenibacillus apiarius]MCY9686885.1 DUF86 domain-containing protein [Paenibacillus apiarius]